MLRRTAALTANDDKLDVVVWKSFSDKQWSKLIAFGQCKTGTSWDDGATIELQPIDFCRKWFVDMTVADPVKMFFCTQYFPLNSYEKVVNAGVVFDRFRILDYLPENLNKSLMAKIQSWGRLAIEGNANIGLPTLKRNRKK